MLLVTAPAMKISFTFATPNIKDPSILAVRGRVEDGLRLIGKAGFDGAELIVRDPVSMSSRQIRNVATEHELAVPAVGTDPMHREDGLSLCDPDPALRSRSVDEARLAVDFAAALGAQLNIGLLRGQLPAEQQDAAIDHARESFQAVMSHAAGCGVQVGIEPLSSMVCNWINTIDDALVWIAQFDPRPTIVFDLFHASIEEDSVPAALIRAASDLSWVHLSDSNRRAPGLGHFPLVDTIRILDALDYDGYLSVECRQEPDSAAAARQAAVYLAPILAELGS